MKIVVCIKQVPDSAQIRVHPVTNTIMRQGVPTIINPYDLFALEEALRLRDKFGGEVTVLTMGPPIGRGHPAQGADLRRRPRGAADRPLFRRRPTRWRRPMRWRTAIRKIGRSLARPTSSSPASRRSTATPRRSAPASPSGSGCMQLTYVSRIDDARSRAGADRRRAPRRRRRAGAATRLPCLITMLEGTNEMRRGSHRRCVARGARRRSSHGARKDAGIEDITKCGLRGSPTIVKKVFAPTPRCRKAPRSSSRRDQPAMPRR